MPLDDASVDQTIPARRSLRRVVLYVVGAIVAVLVPTFVVAGVAGDFGIHPAATADGEHVVTVWRMLMVMATAVATIVLLLLAAAVVAGARRKVPSQSKGNPRLEVGYTLAPLALVAVIFGVSVWLNRAMTSATEGEALEIEADAFRWGWRFTYPNGHEIVSSSERNEAVILLPVDRTVEFNLHSEDVIHSFAVPSFVTKLDVIPGRDNTLRVRPTELGEYQGHCTEFCGLDHARMNFRVAIVSQEDFDSWLVSRRDRP